MELKIREMVTCSLSGAYIEVVRCRTCDYLNKEKGIRLGKVNCDYEEIQRSKGKLRVKLGDIE